jgi:hypothetical protein
MRAQRLGIFDRCNQRVFSRRKRTPNVNANLIAEPGPHPTRAEDQKHCCSSHEVAMEMIFHCCPGDDFLIPRSRLMARQLSLSTASRQLQTQTL